ncbi:hypothetical protein B0H17DRAFT_1193735 [Mycena rosella]|uniref:Uncharacterized protein n=1 Tax=Mycena rosella TaxID=1033263 RepID=A0AAD7GSX0_MYCRO|nr:hypothetical protein B0H17DRAFT_1193735 [Mycena rosella]
MPLRGPSGRFTRRPRVRVDVDIDAAYPEAYADAGSTTAIESASTRGTRTASPCRSLERERDRAIEMDVEAEMKVPTVLTKPVRARRISTKLQHQNSDRGGAAWYKGKAECGRAQGRQAAGGVPVATPVAAPAPKQPTPTPTPAPAPSRPADVHAKEHADDAAPASPADAPAPAPSPSTAASPSPAEDKNEDAPRIVLGKRRRASGAAPKPDTYKVMWNLLERLLEEITVGDARRYQQISIAMGGRQVSSRVQKYRQKLKKVGVGVDAGCG